MTPRDIREAGNRKLLDLAKHLRERAALEIDAAQQLELFVAHRRCEWNFTHPKTSKEKLCGDSS